MTENCYICGAFLSEYDAEDGTTIYECHTCDRLFNRPPDAYV